MGTSQGRNKTMTEKITAQDGLKRFIKECNINSVGEILDIGCGKNQTHANILRELGFIVSTNDFFPDATYEGKYTEINLGRRFSGIWTAHVLEHQENIQLFLRKIYNDLNDGGILGITVPPLKHKIVGGHLNLFNKGLLLYHLILAGFDCRNALHKQYGYNITVIVKKRPIECVLQLKYDSGDIDTISKYFPVQVKEGFVGNEILDNF